MRSQSSVVLAQGLQGGTLHRNAPGQGWRCRPRNTPIKRKMSPHGVSGFGKGVDRAAKGANNQRQQKRFDGILDKWEEQARRMDAVLEKMEKR
jgi:hypothetical protein